jgi:hypothetical protein
MADPVMEALDALKLRQADLRAELKRIDSAITALAELVTVEVDSASAPNGQSAQHPRPSVRSMLVSLLDEEDRDWSVKEILAEYIDRGTPVHGTRPDNSLRAAIVDAEKAAQIKRVSTGRYRSTKFDPMKGPVHWSAADQTVLAGLKGTDALG